MGKAGECLRHHSRDNEPHEERQQRQPPKQPPYEGQKGVGFFGHWASRLFTQAAGSMTLNRVLAVKGMKNAATTAATGMNLR